ncbi:MAG: response regulator transcription factor [Gemmatimonadota bacterium]
MARGRPPGIAKSRLIIVDDHRMVVEGFCSTLAPTYDIVGVAYGSEDLLALLRSRRADCLLLDLQLPDRHGINLIPDVLALQPELRILIVTMFLDRCLADAALAAGAYGFIPKDASGDELRCAITDVLAGRRHLSPRVPKRSERTSLDALHPGYQCLTPRQQAVVRLFGDGKTETEIADVLGVAPSTVTFHKQKAQRALGLRTDSELLRYAVLIRLCLEDKIATASSASSTARGGAVALPPG